MPEWSMTKFTLNLLTKKRQEPICIVLLLRKN